MLHIKVDRNSFLKQLQVVEKAISDNTIRPVISGLYIEARNNKIILRGTNLELTINSIMDGKILSEGKIVLKFDIIDEYIKQLESDEIEILEEEGKAVIISQNVMSEFSIYNAEDYPNLREYNMDDSLKIDYNIILRAFDKSRIAADMTGEKIAINCIRLEIENNKLKVISTDSFRMVYYEEDIENENINLKVSIPLKTVDSILKILKLIDDIEKIDIKYEGNQIIFKIKNVDIISRIIELEFPNYKAVLDSIKTDKRVLVKTDNFISLLKRAQIFARNNINVKNGSTFLVENNKLIVKAISENAKIKEEIDIIKEGEDIKIALNVKYLLDFINMIEKETLELLLSNSNSPVLIKAEGENNFIYLTMPLALIES